MSLVSFKPLAKTVIPSLIVLAVVDHELIETPLVWGGIQVMYLAYSMSTSALIVIYTSPSTAATCKITTLLETSLQASVYIQWTRSVIPQDWSSFTKTLVQR